MPKRFSLVLISFICSFFFSTLVFAVEPLNLSILKQNLIAYHDSGEYESDIAKAISDGERYLKQKIAENNASENKQKLAIILDIDETAVTSYDYMLKSDFSSQKEVLLVKLKQTSFPAFPEVLALYKFAQQNNVATFFITGRKETQRMDTAKELKFAGYKNWDYLYMVNDSSFQNPAANFKTAIRKKITAMDYDIVLNIGDQYSDLLGGYADYVVKLPNPYYFVP